MREIKFRAWDKQNKVMSTVYQIRYPEWHKDRKVREKVEYQLFCTHGRDDGKGFHDLSSATFPEEQIELMQYVGIKDVAGNDIYEGDILAYDTEDGICIAEVVWTKDVDPNRDLSPILGPGYVLTNARHWRNYKESEEGMELLILGNIYENPELLSK